jgi:predicted nucleic acid-binding protein
MRHHVLDASALYRYLTKGPGADIVAGVLTQAALNNLPVLMSCINFGEAYYNLAKRVGLAQTERELSRLMQELPISLVPGDKEETVKAARLKAQYNLPYADAFAAALTGGRHVLVTSDTEHFQRVPKLRLLKLPSAK